VGDTSFNNRWTPAPVPGLKDKALDVATGDSHTCAAIVGGEVYCWGDNYFGELGNGATAQQVVPVLVVKKPEKKSH
jgi:alpha-tubulin suppressor-like RCC1 family protein